MLCCDCIEKVEKLEAQEGDYIIITLKQNLMAAQMAKINHEFRRIFKGLKIITVPNILDIKIGKYTNLVALKECCEGIIKKCDEIIGKRSASNL